MFKKLHIQLTAICTLCTAVIVIIITISCLYIFEKGMKDKEYGLFLTATNSFHSYIQGEDLITAKWYHESRSNGRYIIFIEDNGVPLSFVTMTISPAEMKLATQAGHIAKERYGLDISSEKTAKVIEKQVHFSFYDTNNQEYYAALSYLPKENGFMSMTSVYSLKPFRQSLLYQRLIYMGLVFLAIICLGIFSYVFTGYVLHPIEGNRSKQVQFIASASHELRSPLTVIRASLAAMKKADKTKAERFEEIIQSELQRMGRLVDDMLSLSRADVESWTLQYEKTDLSELIFSIYERFLPIAKKKEIQLDYLISADLKLRCYCDKQRIEQILTILLDNAVSYTPNNGKILLSAEKKMRKCHIKVIDNGIGISAKDKEHIFERFYRADAAHKSKEHFGLGLAIAKEIAGLHKGMLTMQNTPDGGSTFILILPILNE